MKRRYIITYLKIIIGLTLITIILLRVDFISLKNEFHSLPFYIPLLLVIQLFLQVSVNVPLKKTVFAIFNFKASPSILYKKIFQASFYGFFLPATIGGDAYNAYYFGKKFNNYPKVISGLLLNKIIGITVFFILTMLVIVINGVDFLTKIKVDFDINLASWLIILLAFLFVSMTIFIWRLWYKKFTAYWKKIKAIFSEIKNDKRRLTMLVVYSILFYLVSICGRVFIGKIIGIDLSILNLTFVIMLVNLIILLPITVSGIGVREAGFVTLLSVLGIDNSKALTLSILDFGIQISSVLIGGLIILCDFIINRKSRDSGSIQ